MKRKTFAVVLILEIIFCIAFLLFRAAIPNWFTTMTAIPFEQIGALLRLLSLSGAIGNAAAIILYVAICLIPIGVYYYLRKNGKAGKVDISLPIISGVLFFVIYYMINPGLFVVRVSGTSKMILGMLFYSVFCCYLVLRILEYCVKAKSDWLEKGLHIIFHFIVMMLVFEIMIGCFGELFVKALEWNVSYAFGIVQAVVKATPFALDILIIFGGMKLLEVMKKDKYSEECVAAAERLAKICILSLVITMLPGLVLNVLQVLLRNQLNDVNLVITIPVFSIMFALIVLLLAKYIRETQKVKRELDMFI